MNVHWFNASAPLWCVTIPGRKDKTCIRVWNLFKRRSTDGHWWGVGLVQIGRRHLFLIGRTAGYPEREVWMAQLFFIPLTRHDRYQVRS